MLMYLMDAGRVVLFASFLIATLRFFYLAWCTHKLHPNDVIIQQHFLEHSIAGLFAFIGSLLGLIYSIIHLLSLKQGELSESHFSVAMLFLLMSGIAFMMHMIKEQTPGHPFYVRENGDIESKNNIN